MSIFEAIGSFFASLPSEIYVFLISVLPIIELRGAIPIGAGLGLPFYENYLLSVIGNLLPVPFILLFIPAILDFMARFKIFRPIVLWLRKKADKHKHKVLGGEGSATEGGENATEECDFNGENSENVTRPPPFWKMRGQRLLSVRPPRLRQFPKRRRSGHRQARRSIRLTHRATCAQ